MWTKYYFLQKQPQTFIQQYPWIALVSGQQEIPLMTSIVST